ncbi:MAG TPA: sigma-70 family RNA polymerase sigma factor [Solirubrobacteraceae bacterium]|nr:sigma-70 family RNA polymerase sigma factor [Solirubrobacteraceae bacterium]
MAVVAPRVAPPQQTLTDHELVAAARRGSDRAFEELYRRYAGRIRGYVAGLVGDPGRAEDLTQEIFLNAVRRLRATETPVAFKPWVFEIARNACIDEFRRVRRGPEVTLEPNELEEVTHPAAAPPPEVAVAARQQLDDLRGAFWGLSPQQHRLLVLRELEGRSYDDIGSRLAMSRPMVESGLFRARRKLHHEYDELATGRRCAVVQSVLDDGDERRLRRLGVRQRRQLARHLAHCEACRRVARSAGLSDHWLRPQTLAGRIAALLPVPWLRWRGSRGTGWSASPVRQMPPVDSLAPLGDPAGPLQGLGRAAAAVAAILVAGVGGSVVAGHPDHPKNPSQPGGREAAIQPLRSAAAAATPAAVRHAAQPNRMRARPARSRAGRPLNLRASARGRASRPHVAARSSATHLGTRPVAGARGPAPMPGSSTAGSPVRRVLATAVGSGTAVQSAGAVLRTEAGLTRAALTAAKSVGAVPAVRRSLAHTITAASGTVAASAGTAAAAAGSTVALVAGGH